MKQIFKTILPNFLTRAIWNSSSDSQKIVINSTWLFVDQIIRMGLGLIVGVLLARYLGPENFGYWSFSTAYLAIFAVVAKLGLDNIVIKNLVKYNTLTRTILGTSSILKFLGAGLSFLVALTLMFVFLKDDDPSFYIIGIICFSLFFQPIDVIDLFFQSNLQSKYSVVARIIPFLIFSGVKILLMLVGASLIAFGFVFVFEIILGSILLMIIYRKNGFRISEWTVNKKIALVTIRSSLPLLFAGISVIIYMRIDQIMLGSMVNATVLGNYTSAVKISEAWYFIPTIIVGSAFPSIIQSRKKNFQLYLKKLQGLNDLMTWLGIAIALILTPLADYIIYYTFGVQYIGAGSILAIHMWAGVFAFIGVSSNRHLMVENLTKIIFYKTSIGALLNILFNFILIPKFQANGAAISTLISQIISVSVSNLFFRESRLVLKIQLESFNISRILRKL